MCEFENVSFAYEEGTDRAARYLVRRAAGTVTAFVGLVRLRQIHHDRPDHRVPRAEYKATVLVDGVDL